MGRANKKRGKSKPKELTIPEVPGEIAEQYFKKYGVKFGTDGAPVTSTYGSGSSYGGGYTFGKTKTCTHWHQELELAEGIKVFASGTRHHPTGTDWFYPEVGVYFDGGWDDFSDRNAYSSSWKGPKTRGKKKLDSEIAVLYWPDYGVPDNMDKVLDTLEYALNQAATGREVEVGCIGAHGRTGTALAAMLILLGERDADAAMAWVWEKYCTSAIESDKQEDWLWKVAIHKWGDESDTIYKQKLKEEAAKKKAKAVNITVPLSKGGGGSPNTSKNSTSSSTDTSDDVEEDFEFWMGEAYDEYVAITSSGQMSPDDSIRYLCFYYDLDQAEFEDYITNQKLAEDNSDISVESWEEINAAVLRMEESGDNVDEFGNKWDPFTGVAYCGICGKDLGSCCCFTSGGEI